MQHVVRSSILALIFAALSACGGSSNSTLTPTPSHTASALLVAENWTVSGPVSGTAQLAVTSCDVVGSEYEVNLAGTLSGVYFYVGTAFSSTGSGTLDYGSTGTFLFVEVKYGPTSLETPVDHWNNGSGVTGTGVATIGSNGSGNLNVTVPPSANSPGGAMAPITVSGQWTCP